MTYKYLVNYIYGTIVPENPQANALSVFDEVTQETKVYPINFYSKNQTFEFTDKQVKNNLEINQWLTNAEMQGVIQRVGSSYTHASAVIKTGKNYQIMHPTMEAKEEVTAFYADLLSASAKELQSVQSTPDEMPKEDLEALAQANIK